MTDKPSKATPSGRAIKNLTRRNLAAASIALISGLASRGISAVAHERRPRRRRHRPNHCFLAGTRILTPSGMVEIERLSIGDLVLTASGVTKPIVGIGRRVLRAGASEHLAGNRLLVLIRRSAIDDNVPLRDLWVTEGHAVQIDGVLVAAGRLVNGVTILSAAPRGDRAAEVFHIDLGHHDVVVAEGLTCESLRDSSAEGTRGFDSFERAAEPVGRASRVDPMPMAPSGFKVELESRLRSAVSPWIDRRTTYDRARDRIEERAVSSTAS